MVLACEETGNRTFILQLPKRFEGVNGPSKAVFVFLNGEYQFDGGSSTSKLTWDELEAVMTILKRINKEAGLPKIDKKDKKVGGVK